MTSRSGGMRCRRPLTKRRRVQVPAQMQPPVVAELVEPLSMLARASVSAGGVSNRKP